MSREGETRLGGPEVSGPFLCFLSGRLKLKYRLLYGQCLNTQLNIIVDYALCIENYALILKFFNNFVANKERLRIDSR